MKKRQEDGLKTAAAELTQRTGNPFQDSQDTNTARFHATVTAEREYLEKILKHHNGEAPERKQEHIKNFDKKMERLTRQIEPPERKAQQEAPERP